MSDLEMGIANNFEHSTNNVQNIKILLDDMSITPQSVLDWVSDLSDIVKFTVYTRSDPNWDDMYKEAAICFDSNCGGFPIPYHAEYAYIFSYDMITEHKGNGFSYGPGYGFSILIRSDDTEKIKKLRFRHELLHHLDCPADAMSFYYCTKVSSILTTIAYLILGCNMFKNCEGDPTKDRIMNYQNIYYDELFLRCRKGIKIDWSNLDTPAWLKR